MIKRVFILTVWMLSLVHLTGCQRADSRGPLRVSEANPRYFTDRSGKAVYLSGSHTWNNLVEMQASPGQDPFNYDEYLDFLETYHHNFFRLWAWDLLTWNTSGNREENSKTLAVRVGLVNARINDYDIEVV